MKKTALIIFFSILSLSAYAKPVIYINQIGFDSRGPKIAVIGSDSPLPAKTGFTLTDISTGKTEFTGTLGVQEKVEDWYPDKVFYQADFSAFKKDGKYKLSLIIDGQTYTSDEFRIEDDALAKMTLSSIIHYYHQQRANTPQELEADKKLILFGSDKTVDMHGGWCDASGDVSKYFSHLAYANFVSPQQTPLVTWSLIKTGDVLKKPLEKWGLTDSLQSEAIWGADYIMRNQSPQGYFYMTI